jgi:hypothetical protein
MYVGKKSNSHGSILQMLPGAGDSLETHTESAIRLINVPEYKRS